MGVTIKLEAFSVEPVISSENVTDMEEFNATLISAFCGEVSDTSGGVLSRLVAVGVLAEPSVNAGGSPTPPQLDKAITAVMTTKKLTGAANRIVGRMVN